MYLKQSVNIDELCNGWEKENGYYIITDSFGEEYCSINITTREIDHYGYNGMLADWLAQGWITCNQQEATEDKIIFPQTIGDITFYSSNELITFVVSVQEKLKTLS